jgi:hypothetical protein
MSALKKGFFPLALLFLLVVQAEAGAEIGPVASSTATSATLRWTAPGDDGTEGIAWRYDLRFSEQPVSGADSLQWWTDSNTIVCAGLPDPGEPGSVDSFEVTGLRPESTYYFILRTADEIPNWSYFSNVAVVTTPARQDSMPRNDETPPSPVVGLSATPTAEGINLTWIPSPDADVVGYNVYRSITGDDFEGITDTPLGEASYLDTQILAGLTYYYRVTAIDDSDNESPISQAASATAPSGAPVATRLLAPFPDPCVNQAVLRYEITEAETDCFLRIFDINGRLVRSLHEGSKEQGQYSVVWNLRQDNGRKVSPGIYFCVFSTPRADYSRKLVVLR